MSPTEDPRHTVTPDAFAIAPELMGRPLASPRRRLAAFLVDGMLVGLLSLAGWLLLGLLGAAFLLRMAWRRTSGNVVVRAASFSMGCLGMVVFGVTLLVGVGMLRDALEPDGGAPAFAGASLGGVEPAAILGGAGNALRLQRAENEEEAEEAALELARTLATVEAVDSSELPEALRVLMPEDAPFETEAVIERVVTRVLAEEEAEAASPEGDPEETPSTEPGGEPEAEEAVAALALEDVLAEYAELRRARAADTTIQSASPREEMLGTRIVAELGADTLEALADEIEDLEEDLQDEREAAVAARARAQAAEERGGLFRWFADTLDELGLAFGWGGLYFSFLVAWTNGATLGKRLFGIRIIRLNGEPMSWFMAFERSGGYAAGLATGLLGFAQIMWDANRQGIHDKIAGTVVVRERGGRAPAVDLRDERGNGPTRPQRALDPS